MVHKIQRKDIQISGEEIFLPTDPNSLGEEKTDMETTLDYEPLPTKPEDLGD